jgi:hypothetical protein
MVKDTSQVGVRLSGDVLKKLQQDPDGVSEAIRRRLDQTFELDKYDRKSIMLMEAVLYLSRQVRLHTGIPWNENEGVRRTLMAAIDEITQAIRLPVLPEDRKTAMPDPNDPRWSDDPTNWGYFDDDPKKLGPRLAQAYFRLVRETELAEIYPGRAEREWERARRAERPINLMNELRKDPQKDLEKDPEKKMGKKR